MKKKIITCMWVQVVFLIAGIVMIISTPALANSKVVLWFVILHAIFTGLTQISLIEKFGGDTNDGL